MLDGPLSVRLYWQKFMLQRMAYEEGCDIIFAPGGMFSSSFRPFVTMSRNMLPFESKEARRYGSSWAFLRLELLRMVQKRAFRAANGVIFLNSYAKDLVTQKTGSLSGKAAIIPHGVSKKFMLQPRAQMEISTYSRQFPFRILYVSIVNVYKHQWHVAEAVGMLRAAGYPVQLDLIGPAYLPSLKRLQQTLRRTRSPWRIPALPWAFVLF